MSTDPPKPTESEVRILSVLWNLGPSTVRNVFEALGTDTGYTNVLKLMQIMAEKGLLTRDERGKSHIYKPAIAQERTQRHLVDELLSRAFGGSVRKLLVAALSERRASKEELDEVRKLIDDFDHSKPRKSRATGQSKRSRK